ncbi:hypothetical protein CesoFtcFv8_011492 [Champsocephalus esox]|uniref:Uncharacterized protein n=1 Tax=Champsocephalus esox TaxID=159716 RepID=A0AAN8C2J8_9TELE|nr:hypothetical protein CesoFtcFv8_011492 [Champsocephalus esox]
MSRHQLQVTWANDFLSCEHLQLLLLVHLHSGLQPPPRATVSNTFQRSVYLAELVDAQGNEMLESEGTTGSQYWKQNARRILAVAERDFQDLQGTKRRRLSRHDEHAAGIGEVT